MALIIDQISCSLLFLKTTASKESRWSSVNKLTKKSKTLLIQGSFLCTLKKWMWKFLFLVVNLLLLAWLFLTLWARRKQPVPKWNGTKSDTWSVVNMSLPQRSIVLKSFILRMPRIIMRETLLTWIKFTTSLDVFMLPGVSNGLDSWRKWIPDIGTRRV